MTLRFIIPTGLFTLVAVASFCVWAFGGSFFSSEKTMYAGCAVVLLGLGGLSLTPRSGLDGYKRVTNWSIAFAFAFTIYAILWSIAWFVFRNTFGEIIGSSLGIFSMVLILKYWMKFNYTVLSVTGVVFLFHSLGYYFGGLFYDSINGRGILAFTPDLDRQAIGTLAKLAWGVFYGLGFGAGMSWLLQTSRQSFDKPSTQI